MLVVPLSVEVARVREEIRLELAPETCPAVMGAVYEDLRRLKPEEVDPADVRANGAETIRALFAARVETQDAMMSMFDRRELDHDCITAVRRADLASRYLADHLYQALPVDERPDPWLSVAGGGRPELRSGDLLVTRAVALSSAGIAHIGGVDSQFSHNALVYLAPDGEAWTISAFMEKGTVVEPLDEFLASGLGRIVVLRHEDQALASHAAAAAYARVTQGPFIAYDDKFDEDDGSVLFCSEIARWAYGSLIGEEPTIPFDETTFPAESAGLLRALAIDRPSTSLPADALYDPRFSVVGEWRSVDDLGTMRRHDAVAESMYAWIEHQDYVVDPTSAERATVRAGLVMRRTPGLSKLVEDRILPTSDPAFLLTGLAFDTAGRAIDAALVDQGGTDRTRDQWLAVIEALRVEDEAAWRQAPRRSAFHRTLHPSR